jgi:signal transduction histidine kinase
MPKILVIEDEQTLRFNILTLLDAEGFHAIGAENGEIGFQLAQEHIPDLVICDVMMPEMDGFTVLETLRKRFSSHMMPFIFLTAKTNKSDFRQGMEMGADDYITKPFTRDELLGAIKTQLAKHSDIQKLREKIQELEASNLLKDDFLNTVTHELRNPLTNILMVVEILKLGSDPSKHQSYLDLLHGECSREVELINDLLDLQRIESGFNQAVLEVIDPKHWIPAIAEPFLARAQSRQQTFQITIAANLPILLTDTRALQRILAELLNNACKYTPPDGLIALDVYCNTASSAHALDEQTGITIIVGNKAEIPDAALPYVFDRFYRVPGSDRWHQGGTGLGLTLVKKNVEKLNGQIAVSSHQGWTQFMLKLPIQNTSQIAIN